MNNEHSYTVDARVLCAGDQFRPDGFGVWRRIVRIRQTNGATEILHGQLAAPGNLQTCTLQFGVRCVVPLLT